MRRHQIGRILHIRRECIPRHTLFNNVRQIPPCSILLDDPFQLWCDGIVVKYKCFVVIEGRNILYKWVSNGINQRSRGSPNAVRYMNNIHFFLTQFIIYSCLQKGKLVISDVINWKNFLHYWTFVTGIHRSPLDFPQKGRWRRYMMFSWKNKMVVQTIETPVILDDIALIMTSL